MHTKRILLTTLLVALIAPIVATTPRHGAMTTSVSAATQIAPESGFTQTSPGTGSRVFHGGTTHTSKISVMPSLLFTSDPTVWTSVASQQDEIEEHQIYVPVSALFPNGILVSLPGPGPSFCAGNVSASNESLGVSWGLITVLDNAFLLISIPFDQGHDITNPSYAGIAYFCNGSPVYRTRVYIVNPVGPPTPQRAKFNIRTKIATSGVRG